MVVGCSSRIPVVTSPIYPKFVYPDIPESLSEIAEGLRHRQAWSFLQSGDLEAAEDRYGRILESAPDFYPAQVGLGWVFVAKGESLVASEYFEKAVNRNSEYVPALLGYGEMMLTLEDAEGALESFEAALSVEPNLTGIDRIVQELRFTLLSQRLAQARELSDLDLFEDARDAYQRVIESSPESSFLYVELGRVEFRAGNTADALKYSIIATDLDPFDSSAFILQAKSYEGSGDLEAALVAFEKVDQLDPSDETTQNIERLKSALRTVDLPEELADFSDKTNVTRGEMAAVIGATFSEVLNRNSNGGTVIITDTRDHWANVWILNVTQAGVMAVDPGYRFDPMREVRRGDFAEIVDSLLELIDLPVASDEQIEFSDMDTGHLNYFSAVRVVGLGVIDLYESNTFRPAQLVSGTEIVQAFDRILDLMLLGS
tara:strand:+ start:12154 stop:13443 length:1290 start_codon:yes stop_codon:yes gene_type:complete